MCPNCPNGFRAPVRARVPHKNHETENSNYFYFCWGSWGS